MPSLFSSPKAPVLPPPAKPPPPREDPSIAASRRENRFARKQRSGRVASILTDQGEGLGDAPVSRPRLRSSRTLG